MNLQEKLVVDGALPKEIALLHLLEPFLLGLNHLKKTTKDVVLILIYLGCFSAEGLTLAVLDSLTVLYKLVLADYFQT
jgi:hypothetical protein